MTDKFLYFAYGSNMNKEQIAKRCPDHLGLGKAILSDYLVVERKYADIDFLNGTETEGGLYSISKKDLDNLDKCEGYPYYYDRFTVKVKHNGEEV